MHIALLGTRGVPAAYGGFETAAEEIGRRLVARGHAVTVYCRQAGPAEYLGMRRVRVPALRRRTLETLSSTAASCLHAAVHRPDAAIVFNAANSPLLPLLKARGIPTAVHVDGLEWRRGKWSGTGQRYYLRAEGLAVAWADELIADADAIAAYYRAKFGVHATVLRYGAPILEQAAVEPATARLAELGLEPGRYHLVVARVEPENHVDVIADGYRASSAELPLVVVGGNVYATDYTRRVEAALTADGRTRALGSIYDQELLDALYAGSLTYSHGHSVGGTNPSLLRAMGAGAAVLAKDNPFNREVLGDTGSYFADASDLTRLFEAAEADPATTAARGARGRERAAVRYDWDEVARGYEQMCLRLASRPPLLRALRMARELGDHTWDPAAIPDPRPAELGADTGALDEAPAEDVAAATVPVPPVGVRSARG